MVRAARIDVHQHVVPPFWAEALPANGGDPSGWTSPQWTPAGAIEFMDSQQISTGILSLTAPSVVGWKSEARRAMARRVNDYTAGLVAAHPSRFGHFATLPLPDLEGALQALEYAFDSLRADGVILLSNYGGTYLGDASLEPLWTELDRRSAVVLIHPAKPPISIIPGMPSPLLDYPFDTTRAAVQLVLNGVMSRHRRVAVILSHAGGFLPYAANRFAELSPGVRPDAPAKDEQLEAYRRFYFDTALSSPSALPSLAAFAGTRQILFGSDFPYAPPAVSKSVTLELDAYRGFDAPAQAAVNRENALGLFPRLAHCQGTSLGDR